MVRGSMGSWVTGSVILLRQEAGHLGVVQRHKEWVGWAHVNSKSNTYSHTFSPPLAILSVSFSVCLSLREGGMEGGEVER